MPAKTSLPIWLVLVVIIETIPMFLFPLVALFNPEAMSPLTGGEQLSFAGMIYSARNVAVGIALVVALWLRSHAMLFILILVRLLTDIVDYPTLLFLGNPSNVARVTAIFVLLYYIPAIIALRYLWRQLGEGRSSAAA